MTSEQSTTAGTRTSARVLITVLAAPQPSTQYGDTVCVAGVRIDTRPYEWIRLYPVPYREMNGDHQFHKYEVISVNVASPRGDSRRESKVLDRDSIAIERQLPPWRERISYLRDMVTDDMCGLLAAAKRDPSAPSLGAIEPVKVTGLTITPHGGWTSDELAKLQGFAAQDALFGDSAAPILEAPRMKGTYHYQCSAHSCRGHKQGILDWEFVMLQRTLRSCSDAELCAALKKKFLDEMCGPNRNPIFYVGNQAKRRHVFSVLGVMWPRREDWNRLELPLGL